jgi:hypothetical protein
VRYYDTKRWANCKIIGCDVDMGISITDRDTGNFVLCLKPSDLNLQLEEYKRIFYLILSKIKTGILTYDISMQIIHSVIPGIKSREPIAKNCPYNEA